MKTFLSLGLLVLLAPAGQVGAEQDEILALTRPSKILDLSFSRQGRIAEVRVKEGDWVRKGTVIARLDDLAERANLLQLRVQAADETRIIAAEKELEQKVIDLKTKEQARGGVTQMEIDHAKLDVAIARLRLRLARLQQEQDQRKVEEAELMLDHMVLRSSETGLVEKVTFRSGEVANPNAPEKVIQIVQVDPLRVESAVPISLANRLEVGDEAVVQFIGRRGDIVRGRVISKSAIAESSSETLEVVVEIPNRLKSGNKAPIFVPVGISAMGIMILEDYPPKFRPAGEHVYVSFPKFGVARKAGARRVAVERGGL